MFPNLISSMWLAWVVYWAIAAQSTKKAERRQSLTSRAGLILASAAGFAMLGSPRLRVGWLGERFIWRGLGVYWTGAALIALGLAETVWARQHLGRNWSGVVTVKKDHELVRTGPYRFVRHPIYSGLLVALLGTAIVVGEWRGLVAVAIVTAAFLAKIRIEERFMAETFPENYPTYCAKTGRLIPRLRF